MGLERLTQRGPTHYRALSMPEQVDLQKKAAEMREILQLILEMGEFYPSEIELVSQPTYKGKNFMDLEQMIEEILK